MTFVDLLLPLLLLGLAGLTGMFLLALGLPGVFFVAMCVWLLGAWPGLSMGFEPWSVVVLLELLGVAVFGELVELGVLYVGGRKLKLSRPAMFSAILGGLVGAFVGTPAGPVGAVFGGWLGLMVFTVFWLVAFEAETFLDGLKGGIKALAARLLGLGLKGGVLMGLVAWAGYRLIKHLPSSPLG